MARSFRLPDDPRRAGADVESEIRLHIELRAKEYEAQGMAPEAALEAALVSFGDRESVARECVSVRGGTLRARQRHAWLAELAHDVRSAVRGLVRSPGFALVAVLTLTLGIGANTALFTVARSVLFRPLPYPDSDRLVQVWTDERAKGRESPEWLTPPDFDDWRAQNATLAGMAAFQGWGPDLTGDGEPTSLAGLSVTRGFFDVLGVRPMLGRLFVDADDDAGVERVAVITDGLWRLRFGADPAIIGSSVTLNGEPWTVVGILPASYRPPVPFPPEIYRPMRRPLNSGCDRNCIVLRAIGRMRPGVSLAQAEADLDAIAGRLAADYPQSNEDRGAWLVPLHEQLTGPVRPALAMLGAAAGFVLLVGCVNLATLLLVRGAARRRELAMRAALGAGRGRLVRQQLTEGLVLAGVGGALGLATAWLASGAVARLVPESVRQVQTVGIDAGVVGFAIVLTLLSGGLFAAVPAYAAVRRNLFSTLRATDQGDESHGRRLRAGLVVAELALAVMLLVGAGLMLRSLMRMGQIDLGFRTDGLVVVPVRFPPARYSAAARAVAAMEDVVARVGESRAVRAVALTDVPPLQGGGDQDISLAAVGEPAPEGSRSLWYRSVSPNYLDVMGMRIVSGRSFGPADRAGSAVVGIINEETARRYWRGKDPVGRELAGGGMNILIVGVVADGRPDGPNQPAKTELFLPIGQIPTGGVTFLLDPADGEAAAIAALRAGLAAVDPLIPIGPPELLGRQLDATVAQPRLYAVLVGALAAVALGLAALGVFGVMAYSVALRRREIGVRLALGAGPGNIHRLILRDGIRLAVLGGVVGLIGAAALSRLLGALLFEVSALDPLAYAGAALILGLVAVGAAWLPARRAMGVDPLLAMRQE